MSDELVNVQNGAASKLKTAKNPKEITSEEWKSILEPLELHVTRESGTEQAFSGKFDKYFEKDGEYHCLCCGAKLFDSDTKFNSGCGWPAFFKSFNNDENIVRLLDTSHGRIRTEVRCKKCDAHLGHVFDDGPQERGGERYCINSCSINFIKN